MHRSKTFRQVASATALVGALGAVTAFGVAPLTKIELPTLEFVTEPLLLAQHATDSFLPPAGSFHQSETVRRGDTLAALIGRMGGNDPDFIRFVQRDKTARKALQIRAGRSVQAEIDSAGRVMRFVYRGGGLQDDSSLNRVKPGKRLEIRRVDDEFVASEVAIPLERSVEMRSAQISSSLFAATDDAGIPESVAIKIADIFGGDIDFHRDLRKGDRLRVLYETIREADSLDGPAGSRVIAVEFINDGQQHDAMLFERNGREEYFSFQGKGLRKAFLRNPLEFSRISSGFSRSRLHPVHKVWRAHRGVDFAAPSGTKVRASADGKVKFAGSQNGYGKVIMLEHSGGYSTVYAHLSRFAPDVRRGARVSQGDVIGAVGATGWATGPHLHYEMRIKGRHVDPMRVALPESKPLDSSDRASLMARAAELRSRFAKFDTLAFARFE
ncbi:MAG: peptidoglycan DD-metalloendopeptidase family protein [Quisquiliibacterium sp.]